MKSSLKYVFFFILLASKFAFAQEKPVFSPKPYLSKSGKLFWNKKLPVYLKISSSPHDTAKTYLLPSKLSSKYAFPFYFDTEGDNFIRTRWAVDPKTEQTIEPKIEVLWDIHNDSRPPFTRLSFPKSNFVEVNKVLFFKEKSNIVFITKDESSGTDFTYISINGEPFKKNTEDTLVFDQEGEYTLKFFSVDRVGNDEIVRIQRFYIDQTPPSTSYEYKGENYENIVSGRTYIKLAAEDNLSGVKKIIYKLDNQPETVYSGAISTATLSEGSHTLVYYSIDYTGNIEQKQELEFYVDKKAPYVSYESIGDKYLVNGKEYSSGRTKIKLNALDNKAGVEAIYYSVNGEPYQKYEKPFYLTGKSGNRVIKFYAVDKVGNKNLNVDQSAANVSIPYLDITAPTLKYSILGKEIKIRDTLFISPKTKIKLDAYDLESGVQKITYSINNGAEEDYSSPFSLQNEGIITLTQIAYDNVNNSNRQDISLYVDATGPDIFITFSLVPQGFVTVDEVEYPIYPLHTELYLAATDQKSGNHHIYYSVNNGPDILYNSAIKNLEPGKILELKVKAFDYLGNMSEKVIKFSLVKTRN